MDMDELRSPICIVRALWRSLICNVWFVSGHDYVVVEGTPDNVLVLKCETCGHISISWSFGSLRHLKGED